MAVTRVEDGGRIGQTAQLFCHLLARRKFVQLTCMSREEQERVRRSTPGSSTVTATRGRSSGSTERQAKPQQSSPHTLQDDDWSCHLREVVLWWIQGTILLLVASLPESCAVGAVGAVVKALKADPGVCGQLQALQVTARQAEKANEV